MANQTISLLFYFGYEQPQSVVTRCDYMVLHFFTYQLPQLLGINNVHICGLVIVANKETCKFYYKSFFMSPDSYVQLKIQLYARFLLLNLFKMDLKFNKNKKRPWTFQVSVKFCIDWPGMLCSFFSFVLYSCSTLLLLWGGLCYSFGILSHEKLLTAHFLLSKYISPSISFAFSLEINIVLRCCQRPRYGDRCLQK